MTKTLFRALNAALMLATAFSAFVALPALAAKPDLCRKLFATPRKTRAPRTVQEALNFLDWREQFARNAMADAYFQPDGTINSHTNVRIWLFGSKVQFQFSGSDAYKTGLTLKSLLQAQGLEAPIQSPKPGSGMTHYWIDLNTTDPGTVKAVAAFEKSLGVMQSYLSHADFTALSDEEALEHLEEIKLTGSLGNQGGSSIMRFASAGRVAAPPTSEPRYYRWMKIYDVEALRNIAQKGMLGRQTSFGGVYVANAAFSTIKYGTAYNSPRPYWSVLVVVKPGALQDTPNYRTSEVRLYPDIPPDSIEHIYLVDTTTSELTGEIPFIDAKPFLLRP